MTNSNQNRQWIVALDIGGTHLRTGFVNRHMQLERCETKASNDVLTGPNPNLALLTHITDYLERHPNRQPVAVAIGFPATVDRQRRSVLSASNLEPVTGLNVVDYLEPRLGLPTLIDRDANMLLRWDIQALGLASLAMVVGYYVGTGIGNAICIDGRILVGSHGVAGELGHVPLYGSDLPCGCGNRGCVEASASGRALQELVHRRFPDTPVNRVFMRHSDATDLQDLVRTLAMPVAWEVNILDPDAVVLGGGVIDSAGFPRDQFEAHIRAMARKPLPSSVTQFLYSEGGHGAGLRGAGLYAFAALDQAANRAQNRGVL